MVDLGVTQVVPQVTKVSAASVNTPNNEQSAAFNDHQNGVAWRHESADIDVNVLVDTVTPATTTADLYTFLNRIVASIKKAVNPDATSWATAITALGTTENVHDNYVLLLNHSHADGTHGGQLLQANTHQSVDTDVALTSIHHTLGVGQFQAAAGNHTHAIYELGANKNAANGYAGLTSGLIADNQISTNIARVVDVNTGNTGLQTQINNRSTIGHIHGTTPGEVTITAAGLASNSVTTIKILDNNVTNTKLADDSVDSRVLADRAVSNTNYALDSIDGTIIQSNAIQSRHILAKTITNGNIADSAVNTSNIVNGAITTAKIDPAGLDGSTILANTIDGAKLLDYSVPFTKRSDGAITPTTPRSGNVIIKGLRKWNMNRQAVEYLGETKNMEPYLPQPGNKRYVGLEVNSTGAVFAIIGDETNGTPVKPVKSPNTTGLGFVYLEYGMPYIDSTNILPWLGPDDGNIGGGGGSPIGHVHGESGESLVSSIGLAEGAASFTATPSFYINVVGMHYRHTSGQVRYWSGGQVGPFAVPVSGMRIDAVWLNTSNGLPVVVQGVVDPTTPIAPSFIGDQRSICYVNMRSSATFIGPANDGVNGWITDARQWIGGGGGPTTVNSVPTGGTGVASFTAGLITSSGGTNPLGSVAAPIGSVVGTTDSQIISRKTFTNYDPNTLGTIFKQIANPTVDLVQYQDSTGTAFGNISRFGTFGLGTIESSGTARVLVGGTVIGTATAKTASLLTANGTVQAYDNSAISMGIYNSSVHKANGAVNSGAYGIYNAPTRAAGDTGSYGIATAYGGAAPTFSLNNYLLTGSGDIGVSGVAAFPPNPIPDQTCYRADLSSWYKFHAINGWVQITIPQYQTSNRPASPPNNFRYYDSTDCHTYRYNTTTGTYIIMMSRVKLPLTWNSTVYTEYIGAGDLWNASSLVGSQLYDIVQAPATLFFTVTDPLATIDVNVNLSMTMVPTSASGGIITEILIDSAVYYRLSQAAQAVNQFYASSGGQINIGSLSAGLHTLRVLIFCNGPQTAYARFGSNPALEFLRVAMFENHP